MIRGVNQICKVPIEGGEQTQLTTQAGRIVRIVDLTGRPAPWSGALALSPDGRRLIYPQLDSIESDIMLVEKFR